MLTDNDMELKQRESFLNLGNDYFSLKSHSCFVGIETVVTNLSINEYKTTLKIQRNASAPVFFAFSGANGLCRTTPNGSVRQNNLLNQLISLPNNIDSIKSFFEENGFLFPLSSTECEEIEICSLYDMLNHIKATVLLISEIENPQLNYKKILTLTFFLLFSEQVTLNLELTKKSYSTCKHDFIRMLDNISIYPEITSHKECSNEEHYLVNDTIYGADCFLNIEEYQDVISGMSLSEKFLGMDDKRYKDIVYLYKNALSEGKSNRFMIDFIFNFMKRIGIVKNVYFDEITFYEEPKFENFDERLKQALIIVAKIVIEKEINANLIGIKPSYMVTKMEPSWKADSLISALYFSIFYLKPNSEIYRKCANPACSSYFLVKTSNGRKKYCCANCRNATAQRNHRKRTKRKAAK